MSDENPTPDDGEERTSSPRRTQSSEDGRSAADERKPGDRGVEKEDGAADAADAGDSGSAVTESESEATDADGNDASADGDAADAPPDDVQKYARFKKMDGAEYDRVNEFLRDRTYVTAREWAIARLCADFRTETGVEMTKIGDNLPELVPFMTDTYTPQAVNQARSSFEDKVRKSGATFLYGAMSGFFTAEELDELMYEVSEIAKFLLEVEGVDLSVEEELEAEERISSVMREVREASAEMREEELADDDAASDD
ncbi:hypothetical protein SAMN04488063_3627 [Halopelagius inordinatus]|uniref:Uncharacterized protein n=1 Tax=Halopelagius inordinatus TaxID=553467 RepID=A0A1I2WP76_9EURY|nr:DUF5806 family protein [Halopelagius inordinatus]SFH03002.1 hypothetical protein SAMN04488063_3627 [Halopelagius inordinatus]